MTTLGELCSDVYVLTGRPGLAAETQLAIRTAARKFHLWDFWMRDKQEKLLKYSATSNAFTVDIPSVFANWRKFDYIRTYDQVAATPKDKYIKAVAPSSIFDEFSRNKEDVCYVAGTNLQMKTADAEDAFLVGWYTYPNLGVNNFSSWIADMYPELLVEEAAGRIMQAIGMVEEGNKFVDPQKGSVYHPITGHLQVLRINELEVFAR